MAIGDVVARIVRSDGQELTIGDGDWRIPNDGLENWANLPYNVFYTEIPSHDGAIVTSKRVSSVDRTITAECNGDDKDKLRADAIAFFNPKYTYHVDMTYMGRTRSCNGEQIGFKASEGNMYRKPSITWTILCADPYLEETTGTNVRMDKVTARFGFPWLSLKDGMYTDFVKGFGFPWYCAYPNQAGDIAGGAVFGRMRYVSSSIKTGLRNGFIVGTKDNTSSVNINADGDVPSGIRVTMRMRGEVTNPTVRIGYAYIRVLADFVADDVLEIDTTTLPPVVEINGKNAIHLVDRRSNITGMQVEISRTKVSYDADAGQGNMNVTIDYKNRYLGI